MAYNQPIIAEVFATLRLTEGTLQPPSFFDLVPRLKQRGFTEVEMGEVEGLGAASDPEGLRVVQQRQPRVRCWTGDRTRLVQLSPDYLAVNHAVGKGGYLGWDPFREVFDSALAAFRDSVGELRAETLELGTIDEMVVEAEGFRLGLYLACGGNKIPKWYDATDVACDLALGMGMLKSDGFNTNYNVRVRPRDGGVHIRIDSHFHRRASGKDPRTLIEELHADSNEHFEQLITDHTREHVMGGPRT